MLRAGNIPLIASRVLLQGLRNYHYEILIEAAAARLIQAPDTAVLATAVLFITITTITTTGIPANPPRCCAPNCGLYAAAVG